MTFKENFLEFKKLAKSKGYTITKVYTFYNKYSFLMDGVEEEYPREITDNEAWLNILEQNVFYSKKLAENEEMKRAIFAKNRR